MRERERIANSVCDSYQGWLPVLTTIEKMQHYAYVHGIEIINVHLESHHHGFCAASADEGGNCIMINSRTVQTKQAELVTIAEELGHIETGATLPVADYATPYYKSILKRKNEMMALRYAIRKLLPIRKLRAAIRDGYYCPRAIAMYFGVTEEFTLEAINYYKATGRLWI